MLAAATPGVKPFFLSEEKKHCQCDFSDQECNGGLRRRCDSFRRTRRCIIGKWLFLKHAGIFGDISIGQRTR